MNDKPTGKITTAACKQALADKWPEIFGVDLAKLAKDWKRVSKRGSAARGETVERLFFHGTLPLQALVKENQGVLSEVIIRGFAPFDAGDGEEEDEDGEGNGLAAAKAVMAERAYRNETFEFFGKYPCFRPQDFFFEVCSEEEADRDGHTWYMLTPVSGFSGRPTGYDEQLDHIVSRYLPEGDCEVMEATFSTELSVAEIKEELKKRGFRPSEADQEQALPA